MYMTRIKTPIALAVRRAFFAAAALALFPGSGSCAPAEPTCAPAGCNILVIVVDCLRADHLSLYGYGRKTSPNIDAFAGEAAVFTRAASQAPTTLLSFASIFTSREVSSHGVDGWDKALGDSALTLAGILKIYNYHTAAFVGGLNLNPLFGLDQGFGTYSQINRTDASFKDTLPAALQWAVEKAAKKEKFFLVAHGNDLHTPYVFPAPALYDRGYKVRSGLASLSGNEAMVFAAYKRKLRLGKTGQVVTLTGDETAHYVARYDEGINYADGLLGGFFSGLRAAKLLDDTIVVLTADHGEGLFDHDYFFHDFNLYEDTLRVPLVIRVPGLGRREISRRVQLIDLMPTLLDLAGIAPPEGAQGRSLKPLLAGQEPGPGFDRDIFSESGVGGKVIRSGKWKLIRYPGRTELYDLEKDPGELNDLAGTEKAVAADLEKKLAARLAADKKNQLGEPLPASGKFAADMKRDNAYQKKFYERIPSLVGLGSAAE